MWQLNDLIYCSKHNRIEIQPGYWVASRPIITPLICRLKDAWKVLIGTADAVEWPGYECEKRKEGE